MYHQLIPRDPKAAVLWRQKFWSHVKTEAHRRAVMEMCRRDILFFVNLCVWQYNPQERGREVGPFCSWEFQDDVIKAIQDHIERGEDLVIEKSREMGATWICLIVMLWYILFFRYKKFILLSRDLDSVDKPGDSDSLMWKLEFMLEKLPAWMTGGTKKGKMIVKNPTTRGTVVGEASNAAAGIGGRATAIFCDEFSRYAEQDEIRGGTSSTSKCRIYNFTHTSATNCAAKLCTEYGIAKVNMHWSQHPQKNAGLYRYDPETKIVAYLDKGYVFPPDYNFVMDGSPTGGPFPSLRSPWYDAEARRIGSRREVAMNLDIDPAGSMAQFFDPLVIARLKRDCRPPAWRGNVIIDEDEGRVLSFEPHSKGFLQLWARLDPRGLAKPSRYYLGMDVATGKGATPTCISIFDGLVGEKVGQYCDPWIEPKSAGALFVALCRVFIDESGNGARGIIEMQGPGTTASDRVVELGYLNIYFRTDEVRLSTPVSDKPGWFPTPQTIPRLLRDYAVALANRDYTNYCVESLDECLMFKYDKGGNPVAADEETQDESGARINHADRVRGDALAWKIAKMGGSEKRVKQAIIDREPAILSRQWRELWSKNQDRERAEPASYYTG